MGELTESEFANIKQKKKKWIEQLTDSDQISCLLLRLLHLFVPMINL